MLGFLKKFPKLEKNILFFALFLSAVHLLIIAYAAMKLGIAVPTCLIPEKKMFDPALIELADHHYEVHIKAKMWEFEPSHIQIPKGSKVEIYLSSQDVIHGFHIDQTNVNLMAVPGAIANATHTFRAEGSFPIVCHEYCGAGHHNMFATIEVVGPDEKASATDIPLQKLGETSPIKNNVTVDPGLLLAKEKGCLACHSLNGSRLVGPSFKGLFGKTEELDDGSKVLVDEAYLTESILEPNKKVAKGYSPAMPKLPISNDEVAILVEFIKSQK